MSKFEATSVPGGFDNILGDIQVLKWNAELAGQVDALLRGDYGIVLQSAPAQDLFQQFLARRCTGKESSTFHASWDYGDSVEGGSAHALLTGLAAFNAFLQANVTGPPLSAQSLLLCPMTDFERKSTRTKCLEYLVVDGLSVYQHIPHIELFCLARAIFTEYFPLVANGQYLDSRWMRIRVNAYHQRLLSSGASNARLVDSATSLQAHIDTDLSALEAQIMDFESKYSTEAKVQFLLEKAQIYIMQGLDLKAKVNLYAATNVSRFSYALSGALGKRTKFQQKDISQLVVLAKSYDTATHTLNRSVGMASDNGSSHILSEIQILSPVTPSGPVSLNLNDDTLLESIEFSNSDNSKLKNLVLPPDLAQLKPDEQPQLNPLDQIILLTEATIKDAMSPSDTLTSEEILPYAIRVLSDKPKNWQIYTQALLVRSRIESHRSRTQERSVLQLQVIVDQIIAETEEDRTSGEHHGIPQIQVTQFLPQAKPSELAPVTERLKYVHQLNTPTRWEVETELAYAWSTAGSLISALEIFKRLQLWAEAALCYHSVGQEDKARQIIRRQLFFSSRGQDMDNFAVDNEEVAADKWDGEIRDPPPPHAPRLWCILGDLDQDPAFWQRAWDISKFRYARAQRTLGEYYTRKGELAKAREAYMKATVVNRQNGETWSRLGDIDLRVGNWDSAIIAFQQSIMIDDSDAKTYSNLGSALLSKYAELIELRKVGTEDLKPASQAKETQGNDNIDDEETLTNSTNDRLKPEDILRQSLIAYKRGASIAHSNWQIWDNVITIAGRMSPPSFPDIVLAMRSIIRIRGPTVGEDAIDIDILRGLIGQVISTERPTSQMGKVKVYSPPRGSVAKAVIDMVDAEVIPLITARAALWSLVEKLKLYCRDYAGALACAEKAWRITTSGTEWLEDEEKWKSAASTTDALASAFENYGPQETIDQRGEVEKGWKGKARNAVRGVLGKARSTWEGTDEFEMLEGRLQELKIA